MSLIRKLRIDTTRPLWVLNLPEECRPLLEDAVLKTAVRAKDEIGQVLLFAAGSKELVQGIGKIKLLLQPGFIGWIAYPKKSSGIASDLTRDDSWKDMWEMGFDVVSAVSVDAVWTSLRFKQKAAQTEQVTERRTIEGVDMEARTVTLPQDALDAMKPFKGLTAFFDSMAFTHKKEYAAAIVSAKKPETRARRIDKMIEMVLQLQQKKQEKKK